MDSEKKESLELVRKGYSKDEFHFGGLAEKSLSILQKENLNLNLLYPLILLFTFQISFSLVSI